ncbi:MAG: cell wall-binding repeat-containing protein [Clostridiales bacterium]|nr:cell wall-binding repeat-containing protein [Candidatus Crickella merdequi]
MKQSHSIVKALVITFLAAFVLGLGTVAIYADAGNLSSEESGYAGVSMKNNTPFMRSSYPDKWTLQPDGTWKHSNGNVLVGVKGKGIDVSEHNGKIDWEKVKADGIDFAILRIGWEYKEDKTFKYNVSECERLGIPYGVYLFSYTESSQNTIDEAKNAINILKKYNCQLSYPVYYDLEDAWKTLPDGTKVKTILHAFNSDPKRISAEAKRFCGIVEEAGYTPGIYANYDWFTNYLTEDYLDIYEKWVAQYNIECEYKKNHAVWQFSDAGNVKGITGSVDLNFDFAERINADKVRVSGATRFDTAIAIADEYKRYRIAMEGKEKFECIVVANGLNFPDALTGSYLAGCNEAPILMVAPNVEAKIEKYIKENLVDDGKIYLLGGEGVVSPRFEKAVSLLGTVERLSGQNRYDTNLAILDSVEKEYPSDTLLVCAGSNFADALSASPVGYPLMIVGDSLTEKQKNHLSLAKYKHIYIIGGTAVISNGVMAELERYASESIDRIYGATRYDTSVAVATTFFNAFNTATITSGLDFPDGIAGGRLAMAYNSPLLLVNEGNTVKANNFIKSRIVAPSKLFVLGGEGAISENIKRRIL